MGSNFAPDVATCPHCGLTYKRFRTGMSYDDVYDTLKIDDDPDPSTWTYKRRNRVLRAWCGIKQELWDYHRNEGGCPQDPRNADVVPF